MNWVFYNIVKRLKPVIFGFIDHDCFPIKPFDLTHRLLGHDVYGSKGPSPNPGFQYMWAGFCFYRFSRTEKCKIDFKHRVELGLDTGGGNWSALIESIEPEKVLLAEWSSSGSDNETLRDLSIIDDAFIHIGGASYRNGDDRRTSDAIWNTYLDGAEKRTLAP